MLKKIPAAIHPFLAGIYPVLGLMVANISEVPLHYSLRPMAMILAVTLIIICVLYTVFRNLSLAANITTWILLLFFTYGQVYAIFKATTILGFLWARHRFLLPLWVVLFVLGVILLLRNKASAAKTSIVLNVIFACLVGLNLLQIAYRVGEKAFYQSSFQDSTSSEISLSPGQTPPDIYFIVLDAYGRSDILQKEYAIDNSEFINSLRSQGFYVPSCNQSNYTRTLLSLSSTFNMDYVQSLSPEFDPMNSDTSWLLPYWQNNKVKELLTEMGYKTVVFHTTHETLIWNDATLSYKAPLSGLSLSPFEGLLMETTALRFLLDTYEASALPIDGRPQNSTHRTDILYTLSQLPQTPAIPGPKLVFVHLIIPHPPFVLGANGEAIDIPYLRKNGNIYTPEDDRRGYTAGTLYITKRIQEIIPQIIANSKTPPIIVLEGDHGPGTSVLNLDAYYFPGQTQLLYDTITPVNTFRVLFNTYFNGTYELLPDRSFRPKSDQNYFDMQEVPTGCIAP